MATIRSFIAVAIGAELRERLSEVSAGLQKRLRGVAWVRPENIHLTLKFLGDVAADDIPAVREALDEVAARHRSCALRVGGLGAFPHPARPRVIWAGAEGDQGSLSLLVRDLEETLAALDFTPEKRPYHSHLTLGRVKNPDGVGNLTKILREAAADSLGELAVDMLLLIKSTLTPDGSLFEVVSTHRLSGGSAPRSSQYVAG